jgi:hypothetical protein
MIFSSNKKINKKKNRLTAFYTNPLALIKMKKLLTIISVILVWSCTNQNTTHEEKNSDNVNSTKEYDFPTDFLGAYLSSDYLDELENHGSTKKAQEKAIMSTAGLYYKNENMILSNTWNFHEGGGTDYVKMISGTDAIVIGELSKDTIYSIDFSSKGQITIKDEKNSFKLTQFSNDYKNQDYSNLVNQSILLKELQLDGNVVKFEPNGEILGLDSIVKYSFHEDYYDAGMQVDMIYLGYVDNRPEETFGYSLTDSTFIISKLNCLEKDEEYDYCLVRELGKPFLEFKRKN